MPKMEVSAAPFNVTASNKRLCVALPIELDCRDN